MKILYSPLRVLDRLLLATEANAKKNIIFLIHHAFFIFEPRNGNSILGTSEGWRFFFWSLLETNCFFRHEILFCLLLTIGDCAYAKNKVMENGISFGRNFSLQRRGHPRDKNTINQPIIFPTHFYSLGLESGTKRTSEHKYFCQNDACNPAYRTGPDVEKSAREPVAREKKKLKNVTSAFIRAQCKTLLRKSEFRPTWIYIHFWGEKMLSKTVAVASHSPNASYMRKT